MTLEPEHWSVLERAMDVATVARRLFGSERQDGMIVEECGELLTALARRDRGRGTEAEVDEEVADVLLVLLGAINPDVWKALHEKSRRLANLVERHRIDHAEALL